MIRRHLTPALIAFSVLLLCCLAAPVGYPFPVVCRRRWPCPLAAARRHAPGRAEPVQARACGSRVLLLSASAGFSWAPLCQLRMGNASRALISARAGNGRVRFQRRRAAGQRSDEGRGHGHCPGDRAERRLFPQRGRHGAGARRPAAFVPGDSTFSIGEQLIVHAHSRRDRRVRTPARGPRARGRPDIHSRGFSSRSWAFRGAGAGAGCTAPSRMSATPPPRCWKRFSSASERMCRRTCTKASREREACTSSR